MSNGLLVARTTAPDDPEQEAEFTAWYDEEHSPARLTVPGITTARRYRDVERPHEYVATYDLDDVGVLETEAYKTLRENRSPREQGVIAAMPLLERRIYRQLETPPESRSADQGICGDVLLCVWWTPEEGTVDDFHAWYAQEHIPALMRVPGWLRIRRYERVSGPGSRFLAVHDLASRDALTHELHERAVDTPWRERVAAHRQEYERRVYELWRRFEH